MENTADKIEYLAGFMLPERAGRIRQVVENRTRYMAVGLENIFYPQNASAIVRSCEAYGIQDIYAVEKLVRFSPNVDIVRGTDQWVDIRRYRKGDNPSLELINELKGRGYRIVATSPHKGGFTPDAFDVAAGPFALFFGTEKQGISDTLADHADAFMQVPMYGFVESFNVSVCAAIVISRLMERLRASGTDWRLPEEEKLEILLRWMKCSVKDSENILKKKYGDQ